ncbi:ATP-binding protein [Falsibacillus pallidus]|uniref:ATP-binding protein n=1 Tax=Falsibacillus pallidus TaxID=493781 RepID=UPI003D988CE4
MSTGKKRLKWMEMRQPNRNIKAADGEDSMTEAKRIAFRIAVFYIISGAIWIVLSDNVSMALSQQKLQLYFFFQRYKGWLFILVTGIIIYILVHQRTYRLLLSQRELVMKDVKLQEKTQHYQSLFQYNTDGVFEITRDGKLVSINPEGEEILGFKEEDLKYMDLSSLVPEEEKERIQKYFSSALQGEPQIYEVTLYNARREERITRCSFIPIYINEEITGVFSILKDITESRKNEELLISSEKMSIIGQLAASVAHEIRNPLTSLKGFVQLMDQTKTYDEHYMEIMKSEIERINLISSEMLILGKKQDVEFVRTDIAEILNQVMLLMKAEAHFHSANLKFNNNLKNPVFIKADPNQLKQVFINILKNSLEAISQEGIVVLTLSGEDGMVRIEVEDNGIGIDEERLSRLGEPFYSTKEKGTGLGLTVSFKLIEKHGGTIDIESEKEKGTKVTVTFPVIE